MSRMYIVNHWNNAAAYSGEQIGDRLKDSSALHFHRDGSANVNLYSEETALAKKKSSVPLRHRILPQARRVETLTEQLIELEQLYKSGSLSISEYSTLRAVVVTKRNRAQELYEKAVSVSEPIQEDEESYPDAYNNRDEILQDEALSTHQNAFAYSLYTQTWVDHLSSENSLKRPIQKALQTYRTLVKWTQATKRYIKTLQEV